jgi:DNA polymerase III subunit delta'
VFVIREADRLNPSAADALLKVLEEPPADAVFVLLSARPHELPETILSRCHVVTFTPLEESFVVRTLEEEGAPPSRAILAARLSGGNLGRARRLAMRPDGLAFRDVAIEALGLSATGVSGALRAAEVVLVAAERYRRDLKEELAEDLAPFLDDRGRPEEAYKGAIRRIQLRHDRRVRRAERDYVDWVLLAASSIARDRVAAAVGADAGALINVDAGIERGDVGAAAAQLAALEEARAALADDVNLNPRLVLERAFLRCASMAVV